MPPPSPTGLAWRLAARDQARSFFDVLVSGRAALPGLPAGMRARRR